jgi:hypothetical protein
MKEWEVNHKLQNYSYGRSELSLIQGKLLEFAWMVWGKPRKPSLRIAGLQAKI